MKRNGLFSRTGWLVVALCIAGCGPPPGDHTLVWDAATGRPLETDDTLHTQLHGHRDDLAFNEAPYSTVFARLRELYDVNIDVNWAALKPSAIDPDQKLTLQLRQVSLAEALDRVLAKMGNKDSELAYETVASVIVITTRDELDRRTNLRIYDVTDILRRGLETRVLESRGGFVCTSNPATPPRQNEILRGPDGLINLITLNIEPCSWLSNGGTVGTIRANGNLLIIKQNARAHEQIELFLSTLRNAIYPPPPEAPDVRE